VLKGCHGSCVMRIPAGQIDAPDFKQYVEKNEMLWKNRGIQMTTRTAATSALLRAKFACIDRVLVRAPVISQGIIAKLIQLWPYSGYLGVGRK
jgi:hypothetical protein